MSGVWNEIIQNALVCTVDSNIFTPSWMKMSTLRMIPKVQVVVRPYHCTVESHNSKLPNSKKVSINGK